MSESQMSFRWNSFTFTGGASAVWLFAWIFLAFDTPANHPRITDLEREYIEWGSQKSDAPKKVRHLKNIAGCFKSRS